MDAIDFEFDCFWSQEQNDKMEALEKVFGQKCSSALFEDDDLDDASNANNDIERLLAGNGVELKDSPKREVVNQIIQEDFNDPFAPSNGL